MTRRSCCMVAVTLTVLLPGCAPEQSPDPEPQAQAKGGEDITGPYDVVEDWLKPLPWHDEWTFGLVAGVFAESADRIFVLQGGELPDPRPRTRIPGPRSNSDHRPGHFVLVLNRDGELVESWTQWDHLFVRPHKVTIDPYDPEKHIWIIDDWGQQIFKFTNDGSELVMTLGEKEVVGDDQDHFARPTDMAFLSDGTFLVSDGYVNTRVVKFNKDGEYLLAWGEPGTGPSQFDTVHGVAVDNDNRVYVADRANSRIQIFDENGQYLDEWNDITFPYYLYMSADQNLWVADGETNKILKYNLLGQLQNSWGTFGTMPGGMWGPHQFSVDNESNFYVADVHVGRLQKFAPKDGVDPARLVGQRANMSH